MNGSEKEWLRILKKSLDKEDERLRRLFGTDYVDSLQEVSYGLKYMQHMSTVSKL